MIVVRAVVEEDHVAGLHLPVIPEIVNDNRIGTRSHDRRKGIGGAVFVEDIPCRGGDFVFVHPRLRALHRLLHTLRADLPAFAHPFNFIRRFHPAHFIEDGIDIRDGQLGQPFHDAFHRFPPVRRAAVNRMLDGPGLGARHFTP